MFRAVCTLFWFLVHCPQYLKLWNDLYEYTPLETYVRKEKKNCPLKGNIEISLTDTLQVWIPKMIFSAFITVPSSKLRMALTMSSYLNMSQHIHSKFYHQHLLQVIIYNLMFFILSKNNLEMDTQTYKVVFLR